MASDGRFRPMSIQRLTELMKPKRQPPSPNHDPENAPVVTRGQVPARKPRPPSIQKLTALLRHQKTDKKPVGNNTATVNKTDPRTPRNSRPKGLQKYAAILRRKQNDDVDPQQEKLAVVHQLHNSTPMEDMIKQNEVKSQDQKEVYDVPSKIRTEDVDENQNKKDKADKKDINELFEENNRESSDEYEEVDEEEEKDEIKDESKTPRTSIVLPDHYPNTPHARTSVV